MTDEKWREIAKKILSKVYDAPVRDYSTYEWGRKRYQNAVSVVVPKDIAYQHLNYVRMWLPKNLRAFIGTTVWYGDDEKHPKDSHEVVVAPAETQFDILYIAHTEDTNGNQTTNAIIERLKKYDGAYGIDIYQAASDRLLFRLKQMPDDMDAFVHDIDDLCPDTTSQVHGTPELFRQQVEASQSVYLWWD